MNCRAGVGDLVSLFVLESWKRVYVRHKEAKPFAHGQARAIKPKLDIVPTSAGPNACASTGASGVSFLKGYHWNPQCIAFEPGAVEAVIERERPCY